MCKSVVVAGLLLVAGLSAASAQETGSVLIDDVTIISPERPRARANMDVLIRDGRIERIRSRIRVGSDVRRIDGRGRFLVPASLMPMFTSGARPVWMTRLSRAGRSC